MEPPQVTARVFKAVQTVDVEALSNLPDIELRPVLASLVRMSLIASLDKSNACYEGRVIHQKQSSQLPTIRLPFW